MITRRGAGIIVVAIAVFFLASTTRVGWVHLADAVLWGVVIMSLAVPWISMPGLRLERRIEKRDGISEPWPIEGDDVGVTLGLQNRWWLPRFLVSVSYPVTVSGSESDSRGIFFWSWPRRTANSETPLKLERRGQHSLGDAQIEITGPFGMFRRRRTARMSHGVLAYPTWKPISRLGVLEAQVGQHEGRRKSRTGSDPSGTRAYVPGDPYRSIHWRNSARSGKLAVKEFDTWNDRAVVFTIDAVNVTGQDGDSSLDYAARIAASSARVVEQEGGTVSVVTAGTESPEFMMWTGVMEHLARIEQEPVGSDSLARRISGIEAGKRLIAFFSPESDSVDIGALGAAAQRGVACAAVLFIDADAEAASGSAAVASLRSAGVPVVTCAAGELDSALEQIETGVGGSYGAPRQEPQDPVDWQVAA